MTKDLGEEGIDNLVLIQYLASVYLTKLRPTTRGLMEGDLVLVNRFPVKPIRPARGQGR